MCFYWNCMGLTVLVCVCVCKRVEMKYRATLCFFQLFPIETTHNCIITISPRAVGKVSVCVWCYVFVCRGVYWKQQHPFDGLWCTEVIISPSVYTICVFLATSNTQYWPVSRSFSYLFGDFHELHETHGTQRINPNDCFDPRLFPLRHHEVYICGFDWNVSTTI